MKGIDCEPPRNLEMIFELVGILYVYLFLLIFMQSNATNRPAVAEDVPPQNSGFQPEVGTA